MFINTCQIPKIFFSEFLMLSFFLQCVLATYATIASIILFFKLKPKKQAAVTAK